MPWMTSSCVMCGPMFHSVLVLSMAWLAMMRSLSSSMSMFRSLKVIGSPTYKSGKVAEKEGKMLVRRWLDRRLQGDAGEKMLNLLKMLQAGQCLGTWAK